MAELVEEHLYHEVSAIIEASRVRVARSINTSMVRAYWLIGRSIVEVEQSGQDRARYSEGLIRRLAARLAEQHGRGFGASNLWRMRRFYLAFRKGSYLPELRCKRVAKRDLPPNPGSEEILATPWRESLRAQHQFSATLSWSHYRLLATVAPPRARAFYEIEASRENWSVRELDRQISSLLFERVSLSRTPEETRELARQGQVVARPEDVVRDPLVLEFLGLESRAVWQERDLEQAIVDRMESFLLELGKGFCFVERQKRISIDGDHFYVDLVFYNRLLRCFVLIDLKLGKLTHQDLGQIQMYVNWFDRTQMTSEESPTVGIVLCSAKNDAMVKITLPEDNRQIHASRYQLYLPSEEDLRAELEREREEAERAVRRAAEDRTAGRD